MHTHRFALLLTLLIAAPAFAADARIKQVENGLLPQAALKANIGKTITLEQRMRDLGIAGVSIAVIDGGKIAWTRAYGVRDTVDKTPVTVDTLFQAGSISKPVAALGALRLVKEGKLSLDGDVNEKLKTWRVPDNEFTKDEKVTLRRLTSHTAGLTVHGFAGYAVGTEVPTVVQVLDGQPPANSSPVRVDVKPGSVYRYSGGGYTVMQLLIADVANESFESFMQSKVLDAAGDDIEHLLAESSSRTRCAPGLRASSGRPAHSRQAAHLSGNGSSRSVDDSIRPRALSALRAGSSPRRNWPTAHCRLSRRNWSPGRTPGSTAWARASPKSSEFARFGHGGVDEGFEADMVGYVAGGQGVVIMANSQLSQMLFDRDRSAASRAPTHGRDTRSSRRSRRNPSRKPCWSVCRASISSTRNDRASSMRATGGCSSTSSTSGAIEVFAKSATELFAPPMGPMTFQPVESDGKVTALKTSNGREFARIDP